jgi:hypothetical protein
MARKIVRGVSPTTIKDLFVEKYDGANLARWASIQLNHDKMCRSILRLVAQKMEIKDFFADRPIGFNCGDKFVRLNQDGSISLE